MATKREVESRLRRLIRRLDTAGSDVQGSLSQSLPDGRVIEVVVPDLDASYWTQMASGKMGELRNGSPERADIRVTVSSDHLVDLVDGRGSLFSSYLAGRVKIDGSFADLLRLRKLA